MATATAALRMPEDLNARYERLAKATGRTKTFYMTEALAAEIGRLEYEYGLMKKVEDFRAGRLETVTLDELEESLGLIDKDVQRSMRKLDKQIAKRIVAKLREISRLEDPRSMGKGLTENKSGLWRYRVGDYRIVVDIEDDVLVILVVDVDHRSRVYRTIR